LAERSEEGSGTEENLASKDVGRGEEAVWSWSVVPLGFCAAGRCRKETASNHRLNRVVV